MNLSEERNRQKQTDTLDALKLSEKNRQLAEEYLDISGPEKPELLSETEHQDFSALTSDKHQKSIDYVEHLRKRAKKEELRRYVRFQTSVGGSTAYYLFNRYGWNLDSVKEYLTPEQETAMYAEGIVWNIYSLNYIRMKPLLEQGRKDPELLRRAIDLCYHRYDNAKVLLAGIYLNCRKPEAKKNGGILGLFARNASAGDEALSRIVKFLENSIIDSLPEMFIKHDLGKSQIEEIQAYVRNHPVGQPFPVSLQKLLNGRS